MLEKNRKLRIFLYVFVTAMVIIIFSLVSVTETVILKQITDPPNLVSLIIEVGIGIIITVIIFVYSDNQQKKVTELVESIELIEKKQEKFIDSQIETQEKAEKLAYFMIYMALNLIHSDLMILKMINEKNPEVKDQKKERYVDSIKRQIKDLEIVLNSFGTSLNKEVVWKTLMVIRNSTDEYYHLKQFDEVLGMTKSAIKKVEDFVPLSQRNFEEKPY